MTPANRWCHLARLPPAHRSLLPLPLPAPRPAPRPAVLLKKAAGVESGSGEPNRKMVGSVTMDQVREIAAIKLPDLNCTSLEAACNTVMGTAKNMGITVEA